MAIPINRTGCYVSSTISKQTVIASFPTGSRTYQWLSSLKDSQWTITTFIPEARRVCADVTSLSGVVTHLVLTLPTYTANK